MTTTSGITWKDLEKAIAEKRVTTKRGYNSSDDGFTSPVVARVYATSEAASDACGEDWDGYMMSTTTWIEIAEKNIMEDMFDWMLQYIEVDGVEKGN